MKKQEEMKNKANKKRANANTTNAKAAPQNVKNDLAADNYKNDNNTTAADNQDM